MLNKIIGYFADRHLLTNFIMAGVLIGGVVAWQNTNKEELPDITFDRVRISVSYPGAPAEDVEYFVTEPIEREVRGLDGVYRVTSNSGSGRSNINVELEQDLPNRDEIITEIRNTVLNVNLPDEVIDDPNVRVFKTSKKAIIDIALFHKSERILTKEGRQQLQRMAFALENQLLVRPEVNSVNRDGYLREEIQIKSIPEKFRRFEIPFNTAISEIRGSHVRRPAGVLEQDQEPKVTLVAELNSVEKIKNVVIQGGFEGRLIKLSEVADITKGFEKNESITKVNGHEAIILNVVKNSGSGILVALDAVRKVVGRFKDNNIQSSEIEVVFLDDESIDVRNRLNIIRNNGLIGFLLILITLFVFLDKKSGVWVSLGIPFSLCFTMIGAWMMGYSINGTTLAAVIIVMGMVVDDAIVVAENITRMAHQGVSRRDAVLQGTSYVIMPITAAVVTTCVAFVPLYFFHGRHGAMVEFIPPIIFLMLAASLFESIFILPGHMQLQLPNRKNKNTLDQKKMEMTNHWFDAIENKFGAFLSKALRFRYLYMAGFILLLAFSIFLANKKLKFVMFPNDETRNVFLNGETAPGTSRYETAKLIQPIEDMLREYNGKEAVGFRSEIARSRRGGRVEENRFRVWWELVPPENRKKTANQLIKDMESKMAGLSGFPKLQFAKSWWGQDSGSPIELIVQHNNDERRGEMLAALSDVMKSDSALKNIEVDDPLRTPEYRIDLKREKVKRLSISPSDITSTFRAALEGVILFEFSNGNEEVYVRFTTEDDVKKDIEKVLDLPVENRGNYLVPLRNLIDIKKTESPISIERQDLKRTSRIYAGIEKAAKKTPLDIAAHYENEVFPKILSKYPEATILFGGEIQDTRESQSDFSNAVILVIGLIFVILAVLFNSVVLPLVIMLAIPFGVVGIILAFILHGKDFFGFYAGIGALGLAGVVINDAIVLLVKLKDEFQGEVSLKNLDHRIAEVAKTRLRAVLLTTLTTVAGLLPTAYGFGGNDPMLAEMMLALSWGLIFGTFITLLMIPCLFRIMFDFKKRLNGEIREGN